jgi:radical SAM-linked protein
MGWRTIKFYYMIGLPEETDEDLEGIIRTVRGALDRARKLRARGVQINLALSPFIPKSHTPFQWEPQISRDEIHRRVRLIRSALTMREVAIKISPLDSSVLEAVFARGDRRLGNVIEKAWRLGCLLDAWSEMARPDLWWKAFEECGVDPTWYANRRRGDGETLPFDHIVASPGRNYFEKQRDRSRASETDPDCIDHSCTGCAACSPPKQHILARDNSSESNDSKTVSRVPVRNETPIMRAHLRFTKQGPLRFIGHLDLAELVHRLMRRLELPLVHSQGFNPQPQISLTPPLPLGFEALGELADIRFTERVDLMGLLRSLNVISVDGLRWTEAEEMPIGSDSLQQAIPRYDYRVEWLPWGEETATLPLDKDVLQDALERFRSSATWPIKIERKGKIQERDARSFVEKITAANSEREGAMAIDVSIRSEGGTTLSPLTVLEALFEGSVRKGVLLLATRQPVEFPKDA